MKKPSFEEMAQAMKANHAGFIKHAEQMNYAATDGTTSSWVQLEILTPQIYGLGAVYTKVFLLDDYALISTEYIDKRRKRRFLYSDYGRVEILAIEVIDYMVACYKNDFHVNKWSNKLVKKWSKCGFDKLHDEATNGKIIDTF